MSDDEADILDPDLDRGVLQLRPFFFEWPVSASTFAHCCVYLDHATRFNCDMHASPFECPDNEFVYNEVFDEYGAISRNPENHYTLLRFCPFCGTPMRPSRRDDWHGELEARGLDLYGDAMGDVLDETKSYTKAWRAIGVPERYLTAAWRLPAGA